MKHFEEYNEKSAIDRLIVVVQGDPGTGKTHFSLTAPGPIAYLDLDMGLRGIAEKFNDKVIHHCKIYKTTLSKQDDYEKLWKRFEDAHKEAADSKDIRTIVWDTGSEVWELIRLKYFGKATSVATSYGPLNADISNMIRNVRAHTDKNLIMLHHQREEYKANKPTGKMEFSGCRRVLDLADVLLISDRDEDGFFIKVGSKCRYNTQLVDKVYEEPLNTFADIASEVTGTPQEMWE